MKLHRISVLLIVLFTYLMMQGLIVSGNAGAFADDGSNSGTKAWTLGTTQTVSTSATWCNSTFDVSHLLVATNFGFSLPTANTSIQGIQVDVFVRASRNDQGGPPTATAVDDTVELLKTGAANLANGNFVTTSTTDVTYGGSNNLWSTTWTPAVINASTFGVQFAYDLTVDQTNQEISCGTHPVSETVTISSPVTITIYYTVGRKRASVTRSGVLIPWLGRSSLTLSSL